MDQSCGKKNNDCPDNEEIELLEFIKEELMLEDNDYSDSQKVSIKARFLLLEIIRDVHFPKIMEKYNRELISEKLWHSVKTDLEKLMQELTTDEFRVICNERTNEPVLVDQNKIAVFIDSVIEPDKMHCSVSLVYPP